MTPDVLTITGPTASGKSSLAMRLAETLPVEIISVDSAQVYRGMDIGTAKPDPAARAAVPHHLLDIRDPSEPYSAADFVADVKRLVPEIRSRGRLPLLVGGTMLYLRALKHGIAALPAADPDLRAKLEEEALNDGWESLHAELVRVDPEAAQRIRVSDRQRLQRALEVFRLTGRPISALQREGTSPGPFRLTELAVLPPDRAPLHQEIALRFKEMLDRGLIKEVRALHQRGDLTVSLPAIRSVGYRQVWAMLDGEIDEQTMEARAVAATRQLAKRQYTWLRGWDDLHVLPAADVGQALKIVEASRILE